MTINRRLTTALLVAFVLSGSFTFLLSRKLEHQSLLQRDRMVQYVAPTRAVQAGEVLKAGDLRTIGWPATSPVQDGLAKIEDAVGRAALYPLDPGQPLLDRQLTAAGSGTGLASKIPSGMRAIALRSDEVVGVGGFLAPGSHLDVLVTYRTDQSSEPVTATVLQNAEVVAAGTQMEPDPTGKAVSATVVTLLLNPEEAERAVLASTQGSLHYVLRNRTDTTKTDSLPISLSQLASGLPLTAAPAHKLVATGPAPPPDSFLRRSKIAMVTPAVTVPFQIETVLGDQASASIGRPAERTQP